MSTIFSPPTQTRTPSPGPVLTEKVWTSLWRAVRDPAQRARKPSAFVTAGSGAPRPQSKFSVASVRTAAGGDPNDPS